MRKLRVSELAGVSDGRVLTLRFPGRGAGKERWRQLRVADIAHGEVRTRL